MTDELTTAQVAEYLGVKPETVYAYVSRGVLTPARREPRTGSLFLLEDVRSLLGSGRSGRRRKTTVSDDVRTRITEVLPGALSYRGHDVGALAASATFEQARDLLTGHAGTDGLPGAGHRQAVRDLLAALPDATSPLDRFKHAVLLAGATDPGRHDRRPAAVARAGRRALWSMVLTVPGVRLAPDGSPTLAASLAEAWPSCPVELLDAALVLLADHDLAVSTTAVRVAVSSGADAYGALLAGLAAADSPHHMAAPGRAGDWLARAARAPQEVLDEALAADRPPPGFGHVIYTEQDPRAEVLLDLLGDAVPAREKAAVRQVETELFERRGWVLTVDLALALLVRSHGLPRQAGTVIFACARTAGWTAHAIEELGEPGMRFRLRGVYSGPRHVGPA